MQSANRSAIEHKCQSIGAWHILFSLLQDDGGAAIEALGNLKVDLEKLRLGLEARMQCDSRATTPSGKLPMASAAKLTIEHAMRASRELGHDHVGTGHLLLGLLQLKEGLAAEVLRETGVTFESVRSQVLTIVHSTEHHEQHRSPPSTKSPPGNITRLPPEFDKFTTSAQNVIYLANKEAQRLNHDYVGTEHLLLGMVKEVKANGGPVFAILSEYHVDLMKLRLELEKVVVSGRDILLNLGYLPMTPSACRIMKEAMEEANHMAQQHIGTEHVLLGMLRDMDGVSARILMKLGLKLDSVRSTILKSAKPS
jgi:ATP-dependent Clp protease ATP-binding subunit ClpA